MQRPSNVTIDLPMSEDCLNLNIFIPRPIEQNRAVMVCTSRIPFISGPATVSLTLKSGAYCYQPPTELRKGHAFSRICLSTWESPLFITHGALDLTVRDPPQTVPWTHGMVVFEYVCSRVILEVCGEQEMHVESRGPVYVYLGNWVFSV